MGRPARRLWPLKKETTGQYKSTRQFLCQRLSKGCFMKLYQISLLKAILVLCAVSLDSFSESSYDCI